MQRATVQTVHERYVKGEKLVTVTAYDYLFATLVDAAGVDIILVGDSLGTVVHGHETTLPVTLDEMIYHSRLVQRGVTKAMVVTDLPFLSYQPSVRDAVLSAGRAVKESGVQGVKLEGGVAFSEHIHAITRAGIPVMGHVGLTPQSYHQFGGHVVQGKTNSQAQRILADARAVEQAGAFSLVVEGVPESLAAEITRQVSIPTIGIGASASCAGQVLVLHDLLGLSAAGSPKIPRFVKQYAQLSTEVISAVERFAEEVRSGQFPGSSHVYSELSGRAEARKIV